MKQNPYQTPNPYEPELEKTRKDKEMTDKFQSLCYEIFVLNPLGEELYEMLKNQFLLGPGFGITTPNVEKVALYWEGMREVVRMLGVSAVVHEQRVKQHV